MKTSIPFIFSIAGHRDLRQEDIPTLKENLKAWLKDYQTCYVNTELILVSALSEGADMLVASIAKELGITLNVMLPYDESEYLSSFKNEESIETFTILKAYASRFEILSTDEKMDRFECYEKIGEYLADTSNILLALWDGVETDYLSGTSAIVKYARQGFEKNRFDALDGNALVIMTIPRVSNPDVETDFSLKHECLGKHIKGQEFVSMLTKIDKLNAETNIGVLKDKSITKTYMKHFGEKARKNQLFYKGYSLTILAFTAIAIICLEIMHIFHKDPFIIGYGLGLFMAFAVYHLLMKKGELQDNFVYSRGFAEALRIQNAWNHAGLNKSVAKYYLHNQHYKFVWLKIVLKNLYYLDKKPFNPYGVEFSIKGWIDGQILYFKEKSLERHKKLEFFEFVEKIFYFLGLIVLVLIFCFYALEYFADASDKKLFKSIWHTLVLVSGVSFMFATIIGEKYLKIVGYEEEIYHFNIMHGNFIEAKKVLDNLDEKSEEYRAIVYDLGIKALHENRTWVVFHDKFRAEPGFE